MTQSNCNKLKEIESFNKLQINSFPSVILRKNLKKDNGVKIMKNLT